MKKILILGSLDKGHTIPVLQLVEKLVLNGDQVTYISIETFREAILRLGATFVAYPLFDSVNDLKNKSLNQKTRTSLQSKREIQFILNSCLLMTDEVIPWFINQFKNTSFDLVFHDTFAIWGFLIAKYLSAPAICTQTSILWTESLVEQVYVCKGDAENLVGKFNIKYQLTLKPHDIFMARYSRNKVHFSSKKLLKYITPSSIDSETEFFFNKKQYQDSQTHVNQAKNTIYLCLGTIFNNHQIIFDSIMAIVGASKQTLVISTGGNDDMHNRLSILNNYSTVFIYKYVNQDEILRKSSIFITHGGIGSFEQAIHAKIPMIVLPQASEQPFLAEIIHQAGGGINLGMGACFKDSFKDTIENSIQRIQTHYPKYQQNISDFYDQFFRDVPDSTNQNFFKYVKNIAEKELCVSKENIK